MGSRGDRKSRGVGRGNRGGNGSGFGGKYGYRSYWHLHQFYLSCV
jgi:hypothetical protein